MNGQDELHDLWCSQPSLETGRGEDTLRFVQGRTNRFDRAMAVHNWLECIAAGVFVAMFGFSALRAGDALTRAGSFVIAAGAAWIIFYLLRYGRGPRDVDPSIDLRGYAQALESIRLPDQAAQVREVLVSASSLSRVVAWDAGNPSGQSKNWGVGLERYDSPNDLHGGFRGGLVVERNLFRRTPATGARQAPGDDRQRRRQSRVNRGGEAGK